MASLFAYDFRHSYNILGKDNSNPIFVKTLAAVQSALNFTNGGLPPIIKSVTFESDPSTTNNIKLSPGADSEFGGYLSGDNTHKSIIALKLNLDFSLKIKEGIIRLGYLVTKSSGSVSPPIDSPFTFEFESGEKVWPGSPGNWVMEDFPKAYIEFEIETKNKLNNNTYVTIYSNDKQITRYAVPDGKVLKSITHNTTTYSLGTAYGNKYSNLYAQWISADEANPPARFGPIELRKITVTKSASSNLIYKGTTQSDWGNQRPTTDLSEGYFSQLLDSSKTAVQLSLPSSNFLKANESILGYAASFDCAIAEDRGTASVTLGHPTDASLNSHATVAPSKTPTVVTIGVLSNSPGAFNISMSSSK